MNCHAALLGDLVSSRRHVDRPHLQSLLEAALDRTNKQVEAVQPLEPTIGDEFQGLYDDIGAALEATLWIRLLLFEHCDVRFGVGWGTLTMFHPTRAPYAQDGPAWWGARAALERTAAAVHHRESPRSLRCTFLVHDETEAPGIRAGLVNAMLICRDEIVYRMDPRDARMATALLSGDKPKDVAQREGISPSAVSQRSAKNGLYALRAARDALRDAL